MPTPSSWGVRRGGGKFRLSKLLLMKMWVTLHARFSLPILYVQCVFMYMGRFATPTLLSLTATPYVRLINTAEPRYFLGRGP